MSFREQINTLTSLEQCESQNVVWEAKEKSETPIRQPRGRGELPYQLEICNNYYSSSSSQSTPSNKKTIKNKRTNSHKKMYEPANVFQFAHITPSVREANGGWNTQSNEAIERRFRERQQRYSEENIEQNNSDSCNATSSSESSESYKTTLQDSYEIRMAYNERVASNEQVTSETLLKSDLQRYQKNALMLGLLRSVDYTDVEREDTTTESSEDYYDSNSFDGLTNGITNLNIDDENAMQSERIGRFFQSQEDEDVYCHPLKEQIQKDPDWQKYRLKRKGTETIQTSRQYYTSLDDDEFTFEYRKPK